MGKLKTATRRAFLIGSAAVVGGVAFGAYLVGRAIPNPLMDDLEQGEAAITPYIKITRDGITLITPRADMGQGAYSIQADLIAEELDIDPATATLTPGTPGPAYYNAAVLAEGVPFPAYDRSTMAETARSFMSIPAKLFEIQITGGSSTVPDSFEKLRLAGAVARETLKEAAARRAGLNRSDLTTENGQVILPDGTRIPYTDLAADAAALDPISEIELRPTSAWKTLGAKRPRMDMAAKCTGTETYGIDLHKEGMVYATVRANPSIGGGIARLDDTKARKVYGVRDILPIHSAVAVIADNTWSAFQGANALDIKWGPAPFPETSERMFEALEAALGSEESFDHRQRDDGNVEAALEGGADVEVTYRVPYLAHAPMEPMNALVQVTETDCDIWVGTQIPLFIRNRAAVMTGLPADRVHVHVQKMGGSFGHRLEMTHVEQAVEIAISLQGTPVKLVWSREEDMTHDYPRPAAVAKGRGRTEQGHVHSLDLSVAQSAMTPGWMNRLAGMAAPGPDATITTGSWDQPYAIPNYRVTGYRAPDMVPVSSWRSVGASTNGFFHDCLLDELIHAAGADPLAERIRLCMDDTSRKVLEAVGEMCNWDGPDLGYHKGRGVAFCMSFGVPCAQVVDVTLTDAGIKLDCVFVAADVGEVLDPLNLEAQVTGGVLFGLGHAMNCELTYSDHKPEQTNFDSYTGLRLYQVPEMRVKALTNGNRIRGIGEPGVPPAAPALANAIFAATGQRIRELPLNRHIDFV